MDIPLLVDQQEFTDNNSVRRQDVVRKTYWERWMIGMDGERESDDSDNLEESWGLDKTYCHLNTGENSSERVIYLHRVK